MTLLAQKAEVKSFGAADEVRTFPKGRVELLQIGGGTVARFTLEPGWRWSEHVKPIAGTELCEIPHSQYCLSGRLHVRMADGEEFEMTPGDVVSMPPGHDAWVVGNEPLMVLDWSDASRYAK